MSHDFVDVELHGLRLDQRVGAAVDLVESDMSGDRSRRRISIFVARPEWDSIRFALEGREIERPLSHDLLVSVIDTLHAEVIDVQITEVIDRVFYAALRLRAKARRPDAHPSARDTAEFPAMYSIDCRPSDAIGIAVRVGCPIGVARDVLDTAGYTLEDETISDSVLAEFKDFLDTLSPEDFDPDE